MLNDVIPLRAFKITLSSGLLLCAFAAAAYPLLDRITQVRLAELDGILQNVSDKKEDLRTATILIKFRMLRTQGSGIFTTSDDFRREREILVLVSEFVNQTRPSDWLFEIARYAVNGANLVLGWPPVRLANRQAEERYTELGFIEERRRNFQGAIEFYQTGLAMTGDANSRAHVLFHIAFCQQNLGQTAEAIESVRSAGAVALPAPTQAIAAELLQILSAIQERNAMLLSRENSARDAEALFRSGSYQRVVELLQPKTKSLTLKEKFVLARAYEEAGTTELSLVLYREIIAQDSSSQTATQANRRLYMMGAFFGQGATLREQARENAQTKTRDDMLAVEMQATEALVDSMAKPWPEPRVDQPEELSAHNVLQASLDSVIAKSSEIASTSVARQNTDLARGKNSEDATYDLQNAWQLNAALKLSRVDKRALIRRIRKYSDCFFLRDGNRFCGIQLKKTKEYVSVFTTSGVLRILVSEVESQKKVLTAEEFR